MNVMNLEGSLLFFTNTGRILYLSPIGYLQIHIETTKMGNYN